MDTYKQSDKDYENPYGEHNDRIRAGLAMAYAHLRGSLDPFMTESRKQGLEPITFSFPLEEIYKDDRLRSFMCYLDGVTKIKVQEEDSEHEEVVEVGLIKTDQMMADIILRLDFLMGVFEYAEKKRQEWEAKRKKGKGKRGRPKQASQTNRPKRNPQKVSEIDGRMYQPSPSKQNN